MVLGLSLSTFTLLHVVISLIGIASGVVVFYELVTSKSLGGWNTLFLVTTILTSVTGFFFPFSGVTPAIVVGILSLIVLAVALVALYGRHLIGSWRWIYVVAALIALWFNSFVGVVQAFQKIPALNALAPTGSEPPFLVAQLILLALFLIFGLLAVRRFRPALA